MAKISQTHVRPICVVCHLGPWCLPDKKLVGSPPRVVRTPETEDAVLQSFDDDGRRSIFGKGKFNKTSSPIPSDERWSF
jgi:hypothetical protein